MTEFQIHRHHIIKCKPIKRNKYRVSQKDGYTWLNIPVIYHTRKYCIVYSQIINTVQGRQNLQGIDSDRAIKQLERYFKIPY